MFARGVVLVYRPPPPCFRIPLLLVWRRWWARSWLRRWWVAALPSLWLLRRRPSTRDPSHEHSLVRLGVGGGLSIGAGCGRSMSWAWGRSPSVRVPCRPSSSGGGVWRRVVGLGVVGVGPGIVVPPVVVSLSFVCLWCWVVGGFCRSLSTISTPNPPCEQLLAAVVGSGVLVDGPPLLLSFASSSSPVLVVLPSSSFMCPRCRDDGAFGTRDPSCEQWLAARGRVLGYPGVVLVVGRAHRRGGQ
jgi:hypothetical protein